MLRVEQLPGDHDQYERPERVAVPNRLQKENGGRPEATHTLMLKRCCVHFSILRQREGNVPPDWGHYSEIALKTPDY